MGKVLIIDDEKQILGLLSRIIGLKGYEVLQAATCKAGLRQMEQHSPEVVLCDVFLPDGNGVDLVSDLKKLRPLSEIILLTAHGNIPDGVQAIKNGAFDKAGRVTPKYSANCSWVCSSSTTFESFC